MIRNLASKIKFELGLNPVIEKKADPEKFIPKHYKTVLLISADFELAWAWRYSKAVADPLQLALSKAKLERENLPKITKLCEKYNIPITWATVGHLFLEQCKKENGLPHGNLPRLKHFENDFWKFEGKDWFENDPCSNYAEAPNWYCPDLIKLILDSKIKHEIGCHTFSHIDCRDGICSPELMQKELEECKKLAQEINLELKSFVHPGHTIGNLDTLAKEGFTNFRTDYRNVLTYPKKHANGLWEFEQADEFVYKKKWSINYHIHRYKTIIQRAIRSNTVCVLWFHPSFDSEIIDQVWPELFKFIDQNRDKIWVTTHSEYINWLEKN
ncbi:MAG: polysaccharide deacetylase family protein [Bacteroidia bacterium]|nr:polysaccharide deacetylase family protein [Bacteroidia bacterium]